MRHVTLPSVACPALPYFSPLSHEWHDFRRKVTVHKICVLIFSTIFARNSTRDTVTNVHSLHVQYSSPLSDFKETWISSTYLREHANIKIPRNSI